MLQWDPALGGDTAVRRRATPRNGLWLAICRKVAGQKGRQEDPALCGSWRPPYPARRQVRQQNWMKSFRSQSRLDFTISQKVSSALLHVWLVMQEVPSCVKPALHLLQFLLEPSQLRQFSSHLRHTLWGKPGISSG